MWDWSHTLEGIQNVRENLYTLNRETLIECLAEFNEYELDQIEENRPEFGPDYDNYVQTLSNDPTMTVEILANMLWPKVEERATCDNGGFNAHICPYACECHTVPFDLIEVEE